MTVTREDLNPCTVRLSVALDADEVRAGYDRAFKKLSKKIKLPGFRAGQAPRAMLEPLLDPRDLDEEAAQTLVQTSMNEAILEQKLQPDMSSQPSVEFKALDREGGTAEYDMKVALPPSIELASYTGVEVERPDTEVTESDVDFQIEEFRKRRSTREAVTDRGVQEGDIALVNVRRDGEAEGRNFMIVAGQSFPAMDEAIAGLRPEELKALDLAFPDDFQDKALAGKTEHVTLTVNTLSAVRLPQVDDAFAKSLGAESDEDLRSRLREALGRAKTTMADEIVTDKLLADVLERSTVHVSDNMWETLADRRLRETAEEQARLGKTLEAYAKENGMTIEEFVAAWRERAEHEVKRALVIQQIFVKEEMRVTNEDLNGELVRMSQEYGEEPTDLLRTLQQNNALNELQFRSIQRKVREFLLKNAKFVEASPDAETTETAPAELPAE